LAPVVPKESKKKNRRGNKNTLDSASGTLKEEGKNGWEREAGATNLPPSQRKEVKELKRTARASRSSNQTVFYPDKSSA